MILIPSLETVVILVPRTGSGSLYRAILEQHRDAKMLYRHMEADGVPHGYDQWHKVGIVRHPIDRLWSLYRYLRDVVTHRNFHPSMNRLLRESVKRPFNDYLLYNGTVFPVPHMSMLTGDSDPFYHNLHGIPENYKSQFVYLRPDLGTAIYRYENDGVQELARDLKLNLSQIQHHNTNIVPEPYPRLHEDVVAYALNTFAWELHTMGYQL